MALWSVWQILSGPGIPACISLNQFCWTFWINQKPMLHSVSLCWSKLKEQRLHEFCHEKFSMKNAQSCFCLMNHMFTLSRKFVNFPFKVDPPPLMLLSTCWSEALALVKSHDAITQTDRTGKGARLSGSQTGKSALRSAWYQSLLLRIARSLFLHCIWGHMCPVTMQIQGESGLEKGFTPLLEAVKMLIMFLITRAWMSHAKSLWKM